MKKKLSILCSVLYLFNALLHLLLFFGAPLGELVLGGYHIVIPNHLRMINLFFFILWLSASYAYLIYAQIIESNIKPKYVRLFLTAITIFTSIAIFSNMFFTDSLKEKMVMTPFTIIVSGASILLLTKYSGPRD